jgi:altronate hydrolase
MTSPALIRLHPNDNVAVAAEAIGAGAIVDRGLTAVNPIPRAHKIAVTDIAEGHAIIKFNAVIGLATQHIPAGSHVHVHNCAMTTPDQHVSVAGSWAKPDIAASDFLGFKRTNGRVGTRNYIGILTSVNCSATVANYIAEGVERAGWLDDYPEIDGIVPISHATGCGMADKGEPYDLLQRTLWGYAANPNFGAVLMVGLGCEVLQIARFKTEAHLTETDRFQTFTIQEKGGTRRAIESGMAQVKAMLPLVAKDRREPVSAAHLTLALQCGGSDGYSGFTANPALGAAADLLVAQGGTVFLSETPEIFGAEHLLMARAASPDVSARLQARLDWWQDYCARNGAEMNNNPSPGNKAGGLTTILEKSLGAVAKGGTSPLTDVILYGQAPRTKGLVFMDSPGFDPCSATGQIASGANVMCFTTGRGSVFGAKPTPCLKLATNSDLFARMPDDMDIDCGTIATGDATIQSKGQEIFDAILAAASGLPTKSETLGFGRAEFVPWVIGAVM